MSAKWPIHPPVKGSRLSSAAKRHLQKLADTEVASANDKLAKEKDKTKKLRKQRHRALTRLGEKNAKIYALEVELAAQTVKVADLENRVALLEPTAVRLHLAEGLLGPKGRSDLYDAVDKQREEELAKAAAATEEE